MKGGCQYDSRRLLSNSTRLGCYLDSDLIREPMARRVLKKINTKLNLLLRQSNYLNICLEDYSVMNILTMDTRHGQSPESKALKTKLQIAQNKCICFCLGLPPCGHTSSSHFRKIKWLPAERRV